MIAARDHRVMSRRTALAHIATAGVALGLGRPRRASARDAIPGAMVSHPMIGTWLATTPLGPAHVVFAAGGSVLMMWPHSIEDEAHGYFEFTTSGTGTWNPVSARGIRFSVMHIVSGATDVFNGTITIEGNPVASNGGSTFQDERAKDRVTVQNAGGVVKIVLGEEGSLPPMSGIRMWPEKPAPRQ